MRRAAVLAALGAAAFGSGVVCGAIGIGIVAAIEAHRERMREATGSPTGHGPRPR